MTHLWLLLFLNSWFKSEAQGFGMNLIKVPDDDRGQTICTVALLGKYFHSGESLSGFVLHMSITSAATHVQQSLLQALHTDPNYSWTIVVNEARRDYDAATVPQFVMHEKPQCYFIVIENMEDEDLDEMFENWKSNLNWNPLAQFVVYLSAVEESEEEMTDIMIEILLNFMNKKIYNVNIIGQSEESSYYYGKTVFPYHPDNNCGNRVISIETLDLCDYQESEKEDDEEGEEDEEGGEEEEGAEEEGGDKEGSEEEDGKGEDGEEEGEKEDGGEEEDGENEQGKEEGVKKEGVDDGGDKIGGEEEGGEEEGGMEEDGQKDGVKKEGGEEKDEEKEQKKEEGIDEDGGEQMGGEEEGGKEEDGEEDGGKEDGREEGVGDEGVGEEEKGKEEGVDEEGDEKICGGEKGGEEEGVGEEGGKDGNENYGKEGGGEKKFGEEEKKEGGGEGEGKEEGVGKVVDEDNEEKMGAEEDGIEKESGEENVIEAEGGEDEVGEEGGGEEEAMGEGVKEKKEAAEEGEGLEEQNGAEEKKEVENGERESSVQEIGQREDGQVVEESEAEKEVVEEGVEVDKDVVAAELEVVVDEREGNGRGKRKVEEKILREKEKVVIGREIVLVNALVDKGVVKKGEIWKGEKVMKSKDIAEEKEKVQKEAVVEEKRSVKSENVEEDNLKEIQKVKAVLEEEEVKEEGGEENEEKTENEKQETVGKNDEHKEKREGSEDIEEDNINVQENEGEEEKDNIGEQDAPEKEKKESDDTDDDKQKTDVDINSQETTYNSIEYKEITAPHESEYNDPTSTALANIPSQTTTSSDIEIIKVILTTVSNIPQHQTTTSEIEDTDETAIIKDRLETTQSYEFHDIDETSTTLPSNTLHPTTPSKMEYTPSETNEINDTEDSEDPNLSETKSSNDSIYPKLYVEELYRALFLDKFPKDLSGCPLVAAYRPWEPYIFNEALETTENFENSSNTEATNSVNDNNDTSSYGGEGNDGDGDYIVYSESQNTDSEGDGEVPTDSVEVRLNGIEYKMIQTIAERLHISIEMQVENTNLYHLFQQLIDGDIEMVVGGIDEDPSISQFVSSTVPYHQDDLTWCVAKANHTHNLFNFMSTFQSGAWLLTLLFILTASLNILISRKLLKLRLGLLKSYFSINIYVMGIILSQAIHLRPIPTCLKICFGATFFMGLMFSNVYQSFLVSTLTTPKSSYQISHLQEIYQNRMQIMGSVDNVRHLNKEGETYRYVREQFQMCYNIEECLQRTATDAKLAVAVSRQHSFYNPRIPRDHLYCFDRNENIYVYLVTMLMPKKFHLLHKINPVIQHIIESGHMQKWARDLDMRRKITEEIQRAREEPFKSLTINQVGGSFVLHNTLLTLAICVFLVEHLICWLVVKRKTRLKLAKLCHRKFV